MQVAIERDLGSGGVTFLAGGQMFSVDLVGEVRWYMEESPKFKGLEALDAVKERALKLYGVELNYSQADAYLHALDVAYRDLKKKQHDELS